MNQNRNAAALKLDSNSPEPIYSQIKNALLQFIEDNELESEEKLPSEYELGEVFAVSRMTVRRAIDELIRLGVVVRRPGKGLYIGYPKLQQRLLIVTSFSEAISAMGHNPGTRLLEIERVEGQAKICKKMELPCDTPLLRTKRLRLVDDIPFSLQTSYLNCELLPGIEKELERHNLYELIQTRYGYKLAKTHAILESTIADHVFAGLLDIKIGSPLFLMSGVVRSSDGLPIEYFKAYYRGDRMRFAVESE